MLNLSYNPIKAFDNGDLTQNETNSYLIHIEELDLSHCEINQIDPNAIKLFKSLKKLDLSSSESQFTVSNPF